MVLSIAMDRKEEKYFLCFWNKHTGLISRTQIVFYKYLDVVEALSHTRDGLAWMEVEGQSHKLMNTHCKTHKLEFNERNELVEFPGKRKLEWDKWCEFMRKQVAS